MFAFLFVFTHMHTSLNNMLLLFPFLTFYKCIHTLYVHLTFLFSFNIPVLRVTHAEAYVQLQVIHFH